MEMLFDYSSKVNECIKSMSDESRTAFNDLFWLLHSAMNSDRNYRVYIAGNGGSSAIAQHFAADFSKMVATVTWDRTLEVVNLTDNQALLTAYSNDVSYDDALTMIFDSKTHDKEVPIVILISSSGKSENIINFLHHLNAQEYELYTAAFVGFGGGRILQHNMAQRVIHIPTESYEEAEDAHSMALHCIIRNLRDNIKNV